MTSIEAEHDYLEDKSFCMFTSAEKSPVRLPDSNEPGMFADGEDAWSIPAVPCFHSDAESDIAEDIFVTKPEEGLVTSGDPPPMGSTTEQVLETYGAGDTISRNNQYVKHLYHNEINMYLSQSQNKGLLRLGPSPLGPDQLNTFSRPMAQVQRFHVSINIWNIIYCLQHIMLTTCSGRRHMLLVMAKGLRFLG